MEWDKIHNLFKNNCLEQIKMFGKGSCFSELYEKTGREKSFFELLPTDKSGICYLAPSGAGKTNLFCYLASEWTNQHLVFFTKLALELNTESALYDHINNQFASIAGIDLNGQLNEFTEFLNKEKRYCILMFDGIDECTSVTNMKSALHYAIARLGRSPFKIVINCRKQQWSEIYNQTWVKSFHIIHWYPDEDVSLFRDPYYNLILNKYFEKYGISASLIEKAREMCRYPISLRFFCEAYKGKPLNEIDTLRYLYMYIQYYANILKELQTAFPNESTKSISNEIETIALLFWKRGHYFIKKDEITAACTIKSPESMSVYDYLVKKEIMVEHDNGTICFFHQLMTEYLIANALFKQGMWAGKNNEVIKNDIVSIVKSNNGNFLLIPVMEFIYLLMEMIGQHQIMIFLFMDKNYPKEYKMMLCRAAARMGQVDIETWKMLRALDASAESDIKSEVSFAVYMLGENIPGDQVFHSLMLIQCKDNAVLQREILSRLKYDSNFQLFIKRLQPYYRIPEVQKSIIEFITRIKEPVSPQMRLPLLNLVDFTLQFNTDGGIDYLTFLADYAKDDTSFLDLWASVACNHAESIFTKYLKAYVNTVKNDRLKWEKIIRFCLAGGCKDPVSALKIIFQGFESLSNFSMFMSVLTFVEQHGLTEPDAACGILSIAQKKAKFLSSQKQMELRERAADTAINCFRLNNKAFAKILAEIATCDDQKIREKIVQELQEWRKKNSTTQG